jgi:transcriptional regulator with XRE-family HTH domain
MAPPEHWYGISDVARFAGVSNQTIRDWERRGLLSAARTTGGQRRFSAKSRDTARQLAAKRRRPAPAHTQEALPENLELARTGARIKAARQRAGLRQSELADRIGVSRSFLSTVERGLSGVSTRLMAKITDALGIGFSELAPAGDPLPLVRAGERPTTVIEGGVTWEELVVGHRTLEPAMLTIPPGAESGGFVVRPGETFVHVLHGQITFTLAPDRLARVSEDDSLTIFAATPYSWRNDGHESARCLWVEVFIPPDGGS